MKVLVVHSTNNIISGAEYAICEMLDRKPEGFQFEMITPGEGALSHYYRKKGFIVHTVRFSGPRRKYPGLYLITSLAFCFWLKKHGFDIVLCNTFAASFRVSLGTKLAGKKLLIYTREYFSKKKKINFKQIKRANAIIAVSKDIKDYYENIHKTIYVCNDRIDLDNIKKRVKEKQEYLLDKNFINIGFIGRITKYKQPDLFIRAIPYVIKKVQNVKFHLIGKATKSEENFEISLKDLSSKLNLNNYITFWGFRNDSVEIMSELDILCLTSDREPFPRVILEAMAVKTPVICSNTGGCIEIIKNEFSGLYFEVNSKNAEEKLANQILRLINNKSLYIQIQKNALNQVKKNFGGNQQSENLFNILRTVILE